jgi:molecular chaperone HtpG
LLRFYSTQKPEELTSLDEYIERMKEGQKGIYWISGETKDAIVNSPMLEYFRQKGIEVLFLTDPMDEYAFQQLKDYSDLKTKFEPTCKKIKDILGKDCEKVVVSKRLVVTPCVIVTGEYGWTANFQRVMNAQTLRDNSMSSYMQLKKTLEINATHPVIAKLAAAIDADENDKAAKDRLSMLWDTAQLSSGFILANPAAFSTRINRMVAVALAVADQLEELPPIIEPAAPPDEGKSADPADLSQFDVVVEICILVYRGKSHVCFDRVYIE